MKRGLILWILVIGFSFKSFSQPGGLYGCCCLMPTAGCIIGMAMRKDTLRERKAREEWDRIKNLPWYRKLGFGIGYSGGVCYTGEDLKKYSEAWTGTPFDWLYWLNSVEGSIFYPISDKWEIEIGIGYGWADVKGSEGWYKYIENPSDTIVWEGGVGIIKKFNLHLQSSRAFNPLFIGGEIIYAEGIGREWLLQYPSWAVKDSADVIRKCFGLGMFIKYEYGFQISKQIQIEPFVAATFSEAFEFENNSPFKRYQAHKQLGLCFSGIYAGIRIKIGGVR